MSAQSVTKPEPAPRWWQDDLLHDFLRSPVALTAALLTVAIVAIAVGADVVAPYDSNDPASANLIDARLPPGSIGLIGNRYLLGTDPLGRDMLSAIIFGLRTSLMVGAASVLLAAAIGITLGLICGYFRGLLDTIVMRIADLQLSFPAILIALLIDGVTRTVVDRGTHDRLAIPVLIAAIAASYWVQYARTVRGLVLVERGKEYVLAARVTGVSPLRIIATHIQPNVMGPVFVVATINMSLAILTEATLSFLGVGVPPTKPSLGSLVRIGNEFLFSGDWWISIFPGAMLVSLSLSVSLLGDWLRDALDPKLRDAW